MIVYLASPSTQQKAEHLAGMPVLLSYAECGNWVLKGYQQAFKRILVDSGAFTEFSSGVKIDLAEYAAWSEQWVGHADAVAGLDDIGGDWRRSMRNYEAFPQGFPTYHESDPPELLGDLVALALARGQWLGLGLLPPRDGKQSWVRRTLERIPEGLHVHGWAMRGYTRFRRLDSADSTNWFRDAMKLRTIAELSHLHFGECLEIIIKRYQRWDRIIGAEETLPLFAEAEAASRRDYKKESGKC